MIERLKSFLRISGGGQSAVNTTTSAFKLVSTYNVGILCIFTAMVSANQFFGDPISCIGGVKGGMMDSYCWTVGMFVHKGFTGTLTSNTSRHGWTEAPVVPFEERQYLHYYQWLVIVYMLMAFFYALPGCFWKMCERGHLYQLLDGLRDPIPNRTWTPEKRAQLVEYFLHRSNRVFHSRYAFNFLKCQVFLFLVCLANIYFVDALFGGFWSVFTPAIKHLLPFDYFAFTLSSSQLFPRMAKCEFYSTGNSGSTQRHDLLCLLPLNILNEKIFVFLYFWLVIMAFVSLVDLLHSLLIASVTYLRVRKVAELTTFRSYDEALRATAYGSRGEFFMLYLLGKNLQSHSFSDLMTELAVLRKTAGTDV